jgi:hypothetical protein
LSRIVKKPEIEQNQTSRSYISFIIISISSKDFLKHFLVFHLNHIIGGFTLFQSGSIGRRRSHVAGNQRSLNVTLKIGVLRLVVAFGLVCFTFCCGRRRCRETTVAVGGAALRRRGVVMLLLVIHAFFSAKKHAPRHRNSTVMSSSLLVY